MSTQSTSKNLTTKPEQDSNWSTIDESTTNTNQISTSSSTKPKKLSKGQKKKAAQKRRKEKENQRNASGRSGDSGLVDVEQLQVGAALGQLMQEMMINRMMGIDDDYLFEDSDDDDDDSDSETSLGDDAEGIPYGFGLFDKGTKSDNEVNHYANMNYLANLQGDLKKDRSKAKNKSKCKPAKLPPKARKRSKIALKPTCKTAQLPKNGCLANEISKASAQRTISDEIFNKIKNPKNWFDQIDEDNREEWLLDCYRLRTDEDYLAKNYHGIYGVEGTATVSDKKLTTIEDIIFFAKRVLESKIIPEDLEDTFFNWTIFCDLAAENLSTPFQLADAVQKYGKEQLNPLSTKPSLKRQAEFIYGFSCTTKPKDRIKTDSLEQLITYHFFRSIPNDGQGLILGFMQSSAQMMAEHDEFFEDLDGRDPWIDLYNDIEFTKGNARKKRAQISKQLPVVGERAADVASSSTCNVG